MTDPSSNIADAFRKKVSDMADDVGIETLFIVFRDPDTHTNCSASKGDALWIIGALEAKKAEYVRDYITDTESA